MLCYFCWSQQLIQAGSMEDLKCVSDALLKSFKCLKAVQTCCKAAQFLIARRYRSVSSQPNCQFKTSDDLTIISTDLKTFLTLWVLRASQILKKLVFHSFFKLATLVWTEVQTQSTIAPNKLLSEYIFKNIDWQN